MCAHRLSVAVVLVVACLAGCERESGPTTAEPESPLPNDACGTPTRVPDPEARQLTGAEAPPCLVELSALGGDFPVLTIDTGGHPVVDEPKVTARVALSDRFGANPEWAGAVGIELRGNFFSLRAPKKQFGLSLPEGVADVAWLGLPKDERWVLAATPFDRTMLRNALGITLTEWMGRPAPAFRFVEVVLVQSGQDATCRDYVGLYVLTEKLHDDPGRLEVDTSTGYVLEMTTIDTVKTTDPWFCPDGATMPVLFVAPGGAKLTPALRASAESAIAAVARAFDDGDLDAIGESVDLDSLVDYWLVNELLENTDAFYRSLFVHQPREGKLRFGPVWDFDISMSDPPEVAPGERRVQGPWAAILARDEAFLALAAARWRELRASVWGDAPVLAFFDQTWARVATSASRTDTRWDLGALVTGVTTRTTAEEVAVLRAWLVARLAFLDRTFAAATD